MDDVAKRAGVSKAAVSLVLNDKPGTSAEMREAVLTAVEELGYQLPNRRASRRRKKYTLAVVHRAASESHIEPTSIIMDYIEGIQDAVQARNANLILVTDYQENVASDLGSQLLNGSRNPPDGVIIMGSAAKRSDKLVQRLIRAQIPTVALSRNWPDVPISTVSQDHTEQVRIALNHLVELGHRRIGFVAATIDTGGDWFEQRLQSYRDVMTAVNGKVDEGLIVVRDDSVLATRELLDNRPNVTAIFAIHNGIAAVVLRCLAEMGIEVPAHISVISLDDIIHNQEGLADLVQPTVVVFSSITAGYLAADLLLNQLNVPDIHYTDIVLKSKLIEGDSCAKPRE